MCDKLEERGIYLVQDGKYYDLFNLPKDKEFVINGDLSLSYKVLKELPDLSNVIVKGSFNCSCNLISDLKGSPKYVGGHFSCELCEYLTSAEGLPEYIGGKIRCDRKFLTEINKEFYKRKKQANQPSLPPNGFGNDGR